LNTYQAIEKAAKTNTIVMGPWSHGDWARNSASAVIGNIKFGDSILVLPEKHRNQLFPSFPERMAKAKTNYQKPMF
jgi:hypothetical protein